MIYYLNLLKIIKYQMLRNCHQNLLRPNVPPADFRPIYLFLSVAIDDMELLVYRTAGKINHVTTIRGQYSLPVVPPDEKRQVRCGQGCICAGIRLSRYYLQSFSLSHYSSSSSLYAR